MAVTKKLTQGRPNLAECLPLQVTALLLLVLVAYWNSLDGSFHFDDKVVLNDPYVVGPGFGWEILRPMQTRPLTYLTFHWNYLAGESNPEGYHWVNLFLHAANAVLVLLIARRHLPARAAWLAAAIFAIHPLQTQAVNYIFERASLLATFFALLSFVLFLRDRYAWSVAAFGFSLLAKEETVALPALVILYDLVRRKRPLPLLYYAGLMGVAALVAARLFYVLHRVTDPRVGFEIQNMPALTYALTQSRVIWIYLRLFLVPVGLNLDHDLRISHGLLSPPSTLLALIALAALLGSLGWMAWRGKQSAFWALGFFLLLAPSSSLVPVQDVIFEHRTYFPLACLVIVAAWALACLPRHILSLIVAALLVGLLVGTITRNRVWRDDKSLWTDVQKKSPRKARAYFNLAQAYMSEDPARSRQLAERGLELNPDSFLGHTNLGLVMMVQDNPQGALGHFQRAMQLAPETETASVWNNIGAAYLRLGEVDQAAECFGRALKIDPCSYPPRRNLMSALAFLGRKEEAFQRGQVPLNCRLIPAEAVALESYRQSLH